MKHTSEIRHCLLCFLILIKSYPCFSQNFQWATNGGNSGNAVAVDQFGNVYTTGFFTGSLDFDPGAGTMMLTAAGGQDVFIKKQDALGNLVWARAISGTGNEHATGICAGNSGDVFVCGDFVSTVDFDPGSGTHTMTSAGGSDLFILKLDASGNYGWVDVIGGVSNERAFAIKQDLNGSLVTCGYYGGAVDFDPGAGTSMLSGGNSLNGFFLRLTTSGSYIWARQLSTSFKVSPLALALDLTGNIFSTGSFESTTDFDPGIGVVMPSFTGIIDIFILKLDSSGNFGWVKNISSNGVEEGRAIAVDQSGDVITTGIITTTVDLDTGPGTLTMSTGNYGMYVHKLDAAGNFAWAKKADPDAYGYGLAVNNAGEIFASGHFKATVDFDPGVGSHNMTANGDDVYLQKLDGNGNFVWAVNVGGAGFEVGYALTCFQNAIYFCGQFVQLGDFNPGPGTFTLSPSDGMGFLVKLEDTLMATGVSTNYRSYTNIHVFPNPVTDFLTVNGDAPEQDYSLVDELGRVIWIRRLKLPMELDLKLLSSGTYLLKAEYSREAIRIVKE